MSGANDIRKFFGNTGDDNSDDEMPVVEDGSGDDNSENERPVVKGGPGDIRKFFGYDYEEGVVAVAKYYWRTKKIPTPPESPNGKPWETFLIHSKNTGVAGKLSPFHLRDKYGRIMENVWQFAKVYSTVASVSSKAWKHRGERHHDEEKGYTPEFWAWRKKGMNHDQAVRYPNGFKGRTQCKWALWPKSGLNDEQAGTNPDNYEKLDYIQARKKIYCQIYKDMCPTNSSFKHIRELRRNGTNVLIVEVDGPDPTLKHAPYDRISKDDPCMIMDEEAIKLLLHDPKKPFGHGFVIAALLLDGADWLQ